MWKKIVPLLLGAVLVAGLFAGCGVKQEKVTEETEHSEHMEESEVAMAKDIACGMDVPMTKDAATYEHEGETYYFCSGDCKVKFVADPAKYMEAHHEEMHEGDEHGGM